jgi:hypothetical protein
VSCQLRDFRMVPTARNSIGKPQSVNVPGKNFKLRLDSPHFVSKSSNFLGPIDASGQENGLLTFRNTIRQVWLVQQIGSRRQNSISLRVDLGQGLWLDLNF